MKDLGTVHAVGDRFMLRYERTYAHPVDRVWSLVSTGDGLSRWFPARVELDALTVGASMRFTFSAEDMERAREHGVEEVPLVSSGVVREIDPPRLFAFDWIDEPIRIELHEMQGGCRMVFTHTFDRDPVQAPKNAAGWHSCLDALDATLEEREAPKDGPSPELLARYGELPLP